MPSVNFTQTLKDEYQQLFDTATIRADRQQEVDGYVRKLAGNRARYETVGSPLGVPWYLIAVIHHMECAQDFRLHLHNGDPLTAKTARVPAGRPKTGTPPFTWQQSATDAMQLKNLHQWLDWSLAGVLYRLEGYNGWGYRLYHAEVLSPYLWGYSNHYTSGKYVADGTWSDTAVSRQCGAAVLLRRMAEMGILDLAQHNTSAVIERSLENSQPILRYSAGGKELPFGRALQEFLNQFPGVYVKPDGKPGTRTSDAFKVVTGRYLHGDPRGS